MNYSSNTFLFLLLGILFIGASWSPPLNIACNEVSDQPQLLAEKLVLMEAEREKLEAGGIGEEGMEEIPISDVHQTIHDWLENHKGLLDENTLGDKTFNIDSLITNLNAVTSLKEYQTILAAALVENLSASISAGPQAVNSNLISAIDDALQLTKRTFSNNYGKKNYRRDKGKDIATTDIKITEIHLKTWLLACFTESYIDHQGNSFVLTGADEAKMKERLKSYETKVATWHQKEKRDIAVENKDTLVTVMDFSQYNVEDPLVGVNLGNDKLNSLTRSAILSEIKTNILNRSQKELMTYQLASEEAAMVIDAYVRKYRNHTFFFKNSFHKLSDEHFVNLMLPENIYQWLIKFKGQATTKAKENNILIIAILEAIIEVVNKISVDLGDKNFKWGGPEIDFLIKNIRNVIKLPGFSNENNLEVNFEIEKLIGKLVTKNDFSTTEVKNIVENHFKNIIDRSTIVTNNITNNFSTSFEYYNFSIQLLRIQNEINTKIYALLLAQINTKLKQENKIKYEVNHKSFNNINFRSFYLTNELYQNLNIEINFSHVEEKTKNWYFLNLGDIYIVPGNSRGLELIGGKIKAQKLDKKGNIQYYGATVTNKSTYEYSFYHEKGSSTIYKAENKKVGALLGHNKAAQIGSGWFKTSVKLDMSMFGALGWDKNSLAYKQQSNSGIMVTYSGGQSSYQVTFGIKQTIEEKEIILEVVDLKMVHTDSKQVIPINTPTQKIREKKLR